MLIDLQIIFWFCWKNPNWFQSLFQYLLILFSSSLLFINRLDKFFFYFQCGGGGEGMELFIGVWWWCNRSIAKCPITTNYLSEWLFLSLPITKWWVSLPVSPPAFEKGHHMFGSNEYKIKKDSKQKPTSKSNSAKM